MRNESALRRAPPHRPSTDGWLGTHELPGYRAGNVVARLDDLPEVDPHHLYFDLLLLDAAGHTQDNHSGPCFALARGPCDIISIAANVLFEARDKTRQIYHHALGSIRHRFLLPGDQLQVDELLHRTLHGAWLYAHYPDRAGKVMATIQSLRGGRDNDPDFGSRMRGQGVWADLISTRFRIACRKLGLNERKIDLRSDLFRPPLGAQMRLF